MGKADEQLKEAQEQIAADMFFDWLARRGGPEFSFYDRAGEAPDLIYKSGVGETFYVEVSTGHYDWKHCKFLWEYARGKKDAPNSWFGVGNIDEALANDITGRIQEKCQNRYEKYTLLLIESAPGLTSAEDLERLLAHKTFPTTMPFLGVYVVGRFPEAKISTGGYSTGGFRLIPIKHCRYTERFPKEEHPVIERNEVEEEAGFLQAFSEENSAAVLMSNRHFGS